MTRVKMPTVARKSFWSRSQQSLSSQFGDISVRFYPSPQVEDDQLNCGARKGRFSDESVIGKSRNLKKVSPETMRRSLSWVGGQLAIIETFTRLRLPLAAQSAPFLTLFLIEKRYNYIYVPNLEICAFYGPYKIINVFRHVIFTFLSSFIRNLCFHWFFKLVMWT